MPTADLFSAESGGSNVTTVSAAAADDNDDDDEDDDSAGVTLGLRREYTPLNIFEMTSSELCSALGPSLSAKLLAT